MKNYILLALLSSILILSGCKKAFQYSLLEVRPLAFGLHAKAIEKIKNLPQKDVFSFLVISDTQIALDELEDFVEMANAKYQDEEIAFVLNGGDLTDFGANYEYNNYYTEIKKLKFPVINTIGNHDMLGNGVEIYSQYFGPENFTFTYGNSHFVVFNSNSRERGFDGSLPDVAWIKNQLQTTESVAAKNVFFLSHVSPFSSDFNPHQIDDLTTLFASNPNTRLSMHGHTHQFYHEEHYQDGVDYLVAPSLEKRLYIEIRVQGETVTVTPIQY